MRNILTVIENLERIEPSLRGKFSSICNSVLYTAPEAMFLRWRELAAELEVSTKDLPSGTLQKLITEFNGK